MMSMSRHLFALFLAAPVALASAASAQQTPYPSEVRIYGRVHGGAGCSGPIETRLSPDIRSLTVLYEFGMEAEAGPHSSLSNARTACSSSIDLRIPDRWQFAVDAVSVRGYRDVDPGAYAEVQTLFTFQANPYDLTLKTLFVGPSFGDFRTYEPASINRMLWSPCGGGRNMTLRTTLLVSASGTRTARLAVDSIDNDLTVTANLRWRRC